MQYVIVPKPPLEVFTLTLSKRSHKRMQIRLMMSMFKLLLHDKISYQHWKLSVEWEEIIISEIKPKPKLERPQLELLKKYTLDNTKDLRKVLAEPFVWCTQSKA